MRYRILLFSILFSYCAISQVNHSIDGSGMTWSPDVLTINVGDTVTWTNSSGTHNVNGTTATFSSNPESFGNSIGTGWTYEHIFTIAGTYDFQCDVHVGSGMTGTITVQSGGTGINTIIADNIDVFPNPFYNEINITTCNNCKIRIYSLIGKLEMENEIFGDHCRLYTDQLPEGIYLYEISSNHKKIKSGKIIKR